MHHAERLRQHACLLIDVRTNSYTAHELIYCPPTARFASACACVCEKKGRKRGRNGEKGREKEKKQRVGREEGRQEGKAFVYMRVHVAA